MNLRLSILLVAVLLFLGGAALVMRFTGSEETPEKMPWLYRMEEGSIVRIAVSHAGQTVDYYRKQGTADWYIQGEPEIPVYIPKWSGTPLLLSGPKVRRVLAGSAIDPASYGLEPPSTAVTVVDRSGAAVEFHLGDPTPDGEQQYVKLVGDPTIFTLPASWAQVINLLATEPPYLRLFQLEDEALVFFEVNHDGQTAFYGKLPDTSEWFILSGLDAPDTETPVTQTPVSLENWGDTLLLLRGPRVDLVVADTLDNPAEYGLDPPQTRADIGYQTAQEGSQRMEFHLGGLTPDGEYRYARVVGEPKLYAMPAFRAQRIIDLVLKPPEAP